VARGSWSLKRPVRRGAARRKKRSAPDEILEASESLVPLSGNGFEGLAGRGERRGVELEKGFASAAVRLDEADGLQDSQVLGDCLTGEGRAFGELGDRED
jgi:hypothetical protein